MILGSAGEVTLDGPCCPVGERVDVTKEFVCELERLLADHANLARGGPFTGPYLSESQVAGKVNYVTWVNPSRRFSLNRQFKSIRWLHVEREADTRGLIVAKKVLTARDAAQPSFEKCFGQPTIAAD